MPTTNSARRERLQSVVERLRALADEGPNARAITELDAASRRLAEATFNLVVVGEFKRGKSTLINALLGEPILPMGVVPLTSIITEVRHGDEPATTIDFLDGRTEQTDRGDLRAYVTEPENPGNRKGVRRAVVYCPSPLLRERVSIVDTPGIGSIFEHNTEITHRYLSEADAVVVVLAADQPLSAEERRLLLALADITDRILYVVNRVDVLSGADAAISVRFIRETLNTLQARPPGPVFPVSARLALEARARGAAAPEPFLEFEHALDRLLIGRKAEILRERALGIARKVSDELAMYAESERQALGLNTEELDRAIKQFRIASETIKRELEQSAVVLKFEVERTLDTDFRQAADTTRMQVRAAVWPRIAAELRNGQSKPLHRVVNELSASVGLWVVGELRPHYARTQALVEASLGHALDAHTRRVEDAARGVVALATLLLGLRASVPRATLTITERQGFFFRDWDYAGPQLRGHRWMMWAPRRWAQPWAVRALGELLERRIDQNLEAIRHDWATRLDGTVRRFEAQARDHVASLVIGIGTAMERAREARATVAQAQAEGIERIDWRLRQLEALRHELRDLDSPVENGDRAGRTMRPGALDG